MTPPAEQREYPGGIVAWGETADYLDRLMAERQMACAEQVADMLYGPVETFRGIPIRIYDPHDPA